MNKRTQYPTQDAKLGKIDDACQRYSLGKTAMRRVAYEAEAVVRIGRSYLINFSKMDDYMDQLTG